MINRRARLTAWLPVLFWMALIFAGSTDVLASHRTSRFIEPFLRWLVPDIGPAAIQSVQFTIRKCGHVAEYAILGILLRRALHFPAGVLAPWQPRKEAAVFAIAVLYAITDEFHQGLVATRYGSVADVLIDTAGAALGIGLVQIWRARRQA